MAGVISYQIVLGNEIVDHASVSYTALTWQELVIATGSADTAINFGGVTTADVFYLKSDQALTLNVQSNSGTNITVDANKPCILTGSAITSAFLSNSSGTDANVISKIWGV
jgi:hypothetical protein